jgi:hypothetical protein
MVVYSVYYRDYKKNDTNLIGTLTERRTDPKRQKDLIPAALKWARLEFGGLVSDPNAIFIIGQEFEATRAGRSNKFQQASMGL